jgi:hypothetical protein
MLVIRATPANPLAAVEEMVDQAILSSYRYVIEAEDASRELLYGVSVFAHRDGQDLTDVLYRFSAAPMFVEAAVVVIRGIGFEVLPTGTDADHFDVQLISGVTEADVPPSEDDVRVAADRLFNAAAPIRPNPSYAVDSPVRLEEE